jgi:hypothetical protein
LSDSIKEKETDESSYSYERQKKYILGFGGFFVEGGWRIEEHHREETIRFY